MQARKTIITMLALLSVAAPAAAQQIYKCPGSVYQQKPCAGNAAPVKVFTYGQETPQRQYVGSSAQRPSSRSASTSSYSQPQLVNPYRASYGAPSISYDSSGNEVHRYVQPESVYTTAPSYTSPTYTSTYRDFDDGPVVSMEHSTYVPPTIPTTTQYADSRGRVMYDAIPVGPNTYRDPATREYRQTYDRGDGVQQTYRRPIDAFNEVGRALGD